MATISDAVASGCVHLFRLPEWEIRSPVRALWVTEEFLDWADYTPQLHDPESAIEGKTLFEHILQLLREFICAERVRYGDLKRMMPTRKGVWHMYPEGTRL